MKKLLILVVALLVFAPFAAFAGGGDETEANATAGAGAEARLEVNYPDPKRMLPNGVSVNPYPSSQFFQQKPVRTWNISPLTELMNVRMVWTRRQLEIIQAHAPGNEGEVTPIPYNAVPSVIPKDLRDGGDMIAILVGERLPEGYLDKGSVVAEGDDETYGRKMSAAVLLAAMNMGASHFMILIESESPSQNGTSYGLMVGGNYLSLGGDNGGSATGGVAIGGIGWGKIKTKLGLEPYIDGFALLKGSDGVKVSKETGKIVPLTKYDKQRIHTVAYDTYDAQNQLNHY